MRKGLGEADARFLVERCGASAYDVARDRIRDERDGSTLDAGRPRGHWTKVELLIGEMTGREAHADAATRMAERRDG